MTPEGEFKLRTRIESPARPVEELPFDKVMKLPSSAILDGIYAGSIKDPDAIRGYFIQRRTEFLRAHPDRGDALHGTGGIGRWHGLVYSETVEEYQGLAAFADSEIHRLTAALPRSQLDSPSHSQGVANFRRMAESWRQRAIGLSDIEPVTPSVQRLPDPPALRPHEVARPETPVQTPDYDRMMDYKVLSGINKGTITDTEAVHVFIRKSLDSVRELHEGEERREKETEYAEFLYGAPEDMIRFCLGQASQHMAYGAPGAVSPARYKIASRWYAMAGRFAEEAGTSAEDEKMQVSEEG